LTKLAKKRIFLAHPFKNEFFKTYEVIKSSFKDWEFQQGTKINGKVKFDADLEMYKNRNKLLYNQFVEGINKSQIFIADATDSNANVTLELGIAIQLSKNILIVTKKEIKDLPFYLRGFEVKKYKNTKDLVDIIKKDLDLYSQIKNQDQNNHAVGEFYEFSSGVLDYKASRIELPLGKTVKNVKLYVEYKFEDVSDPIDWFGIHLRAQGTGANARVSELFYVRSNLALESVTLGSRPEKVGFIPEKNDMKTLEDDFKQMSLVLDENILHGFTPERELIDENIQIESFGSIILQANAHSGERKEIEKLKVYFRNLKIVVIDTTTPI
jgi:hypothetical protein